MIIDVSYKNLPEMSVRKLIFEIQKKLEQEKLEFTIADTTSVNGEIKLTVNPDAVFTAKQTKFFTDSWTVFITGSLMSIIDDDLNSTTRSLSLKNIA